MFLAALGVLAGRSLVTVLPNPGGCKMSSRSERSERRTSQGTALILDMNFFFVSVPLVQRATCAWVGAFFGAFGGLGFWGSSFSLLSHVCRDSMVF